jgi:tetratricopeptide (TPR) repeat protein/predicted Ser/Thr protein kinase
MPDDLGDDRTLLQPREGAATAFADRMAMVRGEQRREWHAGRRVLAEVYLAQFPELASDASAVVELVGGEYDLRVRLGETPQLEEFTQRFPEHLEAIRRRLGEATATGDVTQATLPLPADLDATAVVAPPKPVRTGKRGLTIPGYEVLGELGRGAMGVVYRARQTSLGREVAVKMVLSGQFAGSHELERFRGEAVQLAKLQHPNIVQVFEVGHCDGRPYFAMEYVPGGSLAKLLEKKPLAARPAAELAETLARAMQHAHERGIIHRDLKPANVLLAADGSPKITDFGLAKGGGSAADTGTFAVLGTPSYMAPEQAGGKSRDVGPPADVYALGAVLYEVLTGRPPFRTANLLETMHLVATTDPVPPGELAPGLPRDLQTITLKCLQKEPARRYATAAALADDLRRFIDGRPIVARPLPAWEKVWKWTKRRPAWAALVVTLVLAAFALVGTGAWFNSRLRHERDMAIASAQLAEERFNLNREAVDRYFTDVSENSLLDEPGLEPLRESLLKRAQEYYAGFVAERRDDPSVRVDYARSLGRLAHITAELKDPRRAIEMYLETLPILRDRVDADPGDPGPKAEVAATWYELGKLYRLINQADAAAAACTTAMHAWESLAAEAPEHWQYRAELARSLVSQSNLEFVLGQVAAAKVDCERALEIRRRLAADHPADEAVTRDLATAWDNLANIWASSAEWDQSLAARRQAADALKHLVAAHPYRSLYRHDLARTQFNFGKALLTAGQLQPAAEAFRDAAAQWDRLHALYPAVREYQVSEGNALFALSAVEWKLGDSPQADQTLGKATALRCALVEQYPGVPEYVVELARCDAEAGDRARQRRAPAAAAEAFGRAVGWVAPLAEQYKEVPSYRADLARNLLNLGGCQVLADRLDDGRISLQRAYDLWTALAGDPTFGGEAKVQTLGCIYALGDLDRRSGKPNEALDRFQREQHDADQLAKSMPQSPAVRTQLRNAWWGKAAALTDLARFPEALAAWDEVIALTDADNLLFMKLYRLTTLARTNEYGVALAELDPLAVQARTSGEALVAVARAYALASGTIAGDPKLSVDDRARRSAEAGKRAVESLELARSKDWFSNPDARDDLDRNPDWAPVRERADFKKLLAETMPVKP